ncbi:MAG: creatininase family protein [Acetobacteraceae bacterium]|nr:creatininase family protein [Acetobacteraceae bacterium]
MSIETEWRKLRADELRERARQGTIVILPIGSLEQHGPHLPVEVDSLLGENISRRTAEAIVACGQSALVLPMVWTGLSEHHMSFGGTITLSLATFSALIEDICRAILRHGFTRIVLLNGHGGNENALRNITDDLTPKLGIPLVQFTYWHAAAEPIAEILETQPILTHACEAETSLMLALRPELVATDRIALAKSNRTPGVEQFVGTGIYRWRAIGTRSASGALGNPEAATADKGRRLLDAISRTLAEKLTRPELWSLPWQADPPVV